MAVRERGGVFLGWRPLGGGVEFGERAAEAVGREFVEEIGQALVDVRLLCVLENLFVYDGSRGTKSSSCSRRRFWMRAPTSLPNSSSSTVIRILRPSGSG